MLVGGGLAGVLVAAEGLGFGLDEEEAGTLAAVGPLADGLEARAVGADEEVGGEINSSEAERLAGEDRKIEEIHLGLFVAPGDQDRSERTGGKRQ